MLAKLLEWFLGALPFFFGLAFWLHSRFRLWQSSESVLLVALICGLWHLSFLVLGEVSRHGRDDGFNR